MATAAVELPSLARDRTFEGLYRRYAKDVYRYALALLRNPTDAEDVTQTTFLNAYRALQRGEEPLKPQNWLIKIAHNAARSRYQRASRRVKEVPLEDHIEQLAVPDEDRPDVEAVLQALGRLPLNQRAALVMRELEGRTYAEIAEALAVSVPAVETLIFRARKSLRVKASSVRVLSVVQLPASLAQLLGEGGGVVAGGSALFGSGFILKAAIAVVAGVVATSMGGGTGMHSAQAAPDTTSVSAPSWTSFADFALKTAPRTTHPRSTAAVQLSGRVASPATRPDGVRETRHTPDGPATSTGSDGSATSSPSPAAAAAVSHVTSTVSSVASAAPSLPVSTPTPTVAVPQLPAPPTVAVPALPPAPPVPHLP